MGALPDDDGDAIDDVDAVVEQLLSLVRVVGCQLDVRNAHGVQHFGGEVVPASISREAEGEVGIQRVVPLVLEGIGLHLGVQTDASAFLSHVDHCTVTRLLNRFHGGFELGSAIASLGSKRISGQAFRVNSNQGGALGEFSNIEHAVLLEAAGVTEGTDFEFTVLGGQKGFRFRLECL